ncbi:MAG: isochorismatase family protein [Candidatus Desulfacyla sp.]
MLRTIIVFVLVIFLGTLVSAPFTIPCAECGSEGKIGVIVVDVQGDFTTLKKGSLAVNGTDQAYVDGVAKATNDFSREGFLIFGTQDWHPGDHVSFFTNHDGKKPFEAIQIEGRTQVLWPPHCIQGTENARVLVDNNLFLAIVKKGQDSRYDSYSGFQDDGGAKTEMDKILKRNMVRKVVVYGLATDYCVKATAIDAARTGYKVIVVEDLCKGVAPDTTQKALEEMKAQGIQVVKTAEVKEALAQ